MKIGIVGLGLIGGSFAKAYKSAGSHAVYGCDTDGRILEFALLDGAIDQKLDAQNLRACDLLLLCVYPEAAIAYLKNVRPFLHNKRRKTRSAHRVYFQACAHRVQCICKESHRPES